MALVLDSIIHGGHRNASHFRSIDKAYNKSLPTRVDFSSNLYVEES